MISWWKNYTELAWLKSDDLTVIVKYINSFHSVQLRVRLAPSDSTIRAGLRLRILLWRLGGIDLRVFSDECRTILHVSTMDGVIPLTTNILWVLEIPTPLFDKDDHVCGLLLELNAVQCFSLECQIASEIIGYSTVCSNFSALETKKKSAPNVFHS